MLKMLEKLTKNWTDYWFSRSIEKYKRDVFFRTSRALGTYSDDLQQHLRLSLPFEILQGEYKGTIFLILYDTIKPTKNGTPGFSCGILATDRRIRKSFYKTVEMILASILTEIYTKEKGTNEQNRDDYFEELVDESRVYSKSDSVHKDGIL